jgi:ABC-type bacteriocin/lantibiotic exporter with double-glycine peptidase domain
MAYELFATIEGERRVHALLPSQKLNFFGRRKSASVTQRRTPGVIAPADRLPANTMAPRILGSEITFRYQEADSSLFSGLSFSINPGQQVGILGRSGSGKSTLLAMILGVLRPSKGRIEIDGKAPDQYFADTRTRIGYVGAEPFLIVGTIRDNLLYGGSADRSDSELMEALESAQLGDWARTKTNPLGFVVGERGEGLSTGQCQRLALARAMLMKPDILILDEASANLDEKTETELTEAISRFKGKCTTLIVSHRKGILSNVDSLIQIS